MKHLKQITKDITALTPEHMKEYEQLLWAYLCYSPKMPLRLGQEHLLQTAERTRLKVNDEYFEKRRLAFNMFKWGDGKIKLLLTHGWGSKAADFGEMIAALKEIKDVQIIAFDAPGCGSSEGELSGLILFKEAFKAVVLKFGEPDIIIGHSLGAMANVIAIQETTITPILLISIVPLIKLKKYFEARMDLIPVSELAKSSFFDSFNARFNLDASHFDLDNFYNLDHRIKHWVLYDSNDKISPYAVLNEFLRNNPGINSKNYEGIGHDKSIKSNAISNDVIRIINACF